MKTTQKVAPLAATLITFGSLAGGANAAVTYYIQDSGSKISVSTPGGVLDLSLETISDGGNWTPERVYLDSRAGGRVGVTNTATGEVVTGTVNQSSGWTYGNIDLSVFPDGFSGSWSGVPFVMVLFPGRSTNNLFLTEGITAGVVNVGAGVFTTTSDFSVAGLGLTVGESVTWTSNNSGDTVTYVVGPVPEPSSAISLGLGAIGAVVRRRRS